MDHLSWQVEQVSERGRNVCILSAKPVSGKKEGALWLEVCGAF